MTIRFINVKNTERTSRGLMGRDRMTREQATIALQTGKLVTCKIGEEIMNQTSVQEVRERLYNWHCRACQQRGIVTTKSGEERRRVHGLCLTDHQRVSPRCWFACPFKVEFSGI